MRSQTQMPRYSELLREVEWLRARVAEYQARAERQAEAAETRAPESSALASFEAAEAELRQQNQQLMALRELLRQECRRYAELFNLAPDGYLVTDPNGVIQEANVAAARWLGVQAELLVGRPLSVFVEGAERLVFFDLLRRLPRERRVRDWEMVLRSQDGATRHVSVNIGQVLDRQGQAVGLRWILRDVTERKQAEKEAVEAPRASEEDYRALFELAAIGRAEVDVATHRFLRVNRKLCEITGYSAEELLGLTFRDLTHPEDRDRDLTDWQQFVRGERDEYSVEKRYVRKDGRVIRVRVDLALRRDAESRPLRTIGVIQDITERKEAERLKDEIISIVSHELRTPLTSIAGSLGLIHGGTAGELPPRAQEMVEIAYRNSDRLMRLINDILDMDKIASGKMPFNLQPVDLDPLLEDALATHEPLAKQFGVQLHLKRGRSGLKPNADPDRLMQVISNLLSNAVKFSPSGETVSVRVLPVHDRVRVEVSDHGPGIAEDFRPRIFEKFARANTPDARAKGGTGLGLSISKAIIEGLGGRIGFESTTGGGTTFYFELPRWEE